MSAARPVPIEGDHAQHPDPPPPRSPDGVRGGSRAARGRLLEGVRGSAGRRLPRRRPVVGTGTGRMAADRGGLPRDGRRGRPVVRGRFGRRPRTAHGWWPGAVPTARCAGRVLDPLDQDDGVGDRDGDVVRHALRTVRGRQQDPYRRVPQGPSRRTGRHLHPGPCCGVRGRAPEWSGTAVDDTGLGHRRGHGRAVRDGADRRPPVAPAAGPHRMHHGPADGRPHPPGRRPGTSTIRDAVTCRAAGHNPAARCGLRLTACRVFP